MIKYDFRLRQTFLKQIFEKKFNIDDLEGYSFFLNFTFLKIIFFFNF